MGKEKNLRAAIYARVSTEDQAKEGFSLAAQVDRLQSYCKSREWEITGEYIDDGYSGRNTKRPGYRNMMQEQDRWDMVVVIKMDRIHRNSKNFMLMMEDLNKSEKGFTSMTEALDTSTAMGRFVVDIIQRIAQLESEQIGERVYIGMEQKAKTNGGPLGFNIPFGYDYVDGKLLVNSKEAATVETIYELYLGGSSMNGVADFLNSKSIPTKMGRTWGAQTVSVILRNPLYCGYFHWEKYLRKGDHVPIVSKDTYNKVQDKLKERSKNKNNKNKKDIIKV